MAATSSNGADHNGTNGKARATTETSSYCTSVDSPSADGTDSFYSSVPSSSGSSGRGRTFSSGGPELGRGLLADTVDENSMYDATPGTWSPACLRRGGGDPCLQTARADEVIGCSSRARPRTNLASASKAASSQASRAQAHTLIESGMFEVPVVPLCVSGGTAVFYALRLRQEQLRREPGLGASTERYIGKDLSHAMDEVDFYEEARALTTRFGRGNDIMRTNSTLSMNQDMHQRLAALLGFMFEYRGIAALPDAAAKPGDKPVELLVLRNLRDGCKGFRMLDVKIGHKTSSANWKGKSRVRSLRQDLIDGFTNSLMEGFRLEGVDGPPTALTSLMPLPCSSDKAKLKKRRRAFRTMLQQMRCAEVLMHFLDVHQVEDPGEEGLAQFRTPVEVVEVVLLEVVRRLTCLALSCRWSPVPQKWIGSSVALAFDFLSLPARAAKDAEIAENARIYVHIFDWGRSDLNTPEKHQLLTDAEQADYERFWRYYIDGIDRLAWEAARAYRHRFGNARGWQEVIVTLVDFDTQSSSEVLGQVRIAPLEVTRERKVQLFTEDGERVASPWKASEAATLTYSVEWRPLPEGSNIAGVWRLCIVGASNLPRASRTGAPHALCEVVALADSVDSASGFCESPVGFRQVTSMKPDTFDPVWHETLDLPVAAGHDLLEEALACVSPFLVQEGLSDIFPPEEDTLHVKSMMEQVQLESRSFVKASNGSNETIKSFTRPPRQSVIHLGETWDDDSGMKEWQCRLDIAADEADDAADRRRAIRSATSQRRLARGEALRLVQQSNFGIRSASIVGGVISSLMALFELFIQFRWQHGDTTMFLEVVISIFHLVLTPCAMMFEVKPKKVQILGLDGCQDCLMVRCGLHRLSARGAFYYFLGALWLCPSANIACSRRQYRWLPTAMAMLLVTVGTLQLLTMCGVCRKHVVRKVMRSHTMDWSEARSPRFSSQAKPGRADCGSPGRSPYSGRGDGGAPPQQGGAEVEMGVRKSFT